MHRIKVAAVIVTLSFLAACGSEDGTKDASPTVVESPSPTVAVQTAIPDGTYRTRPRTEQDLIALGLTTREIANAKHEEHWSKTIVYELRIKGDQFVLTAASDGREPIVADQGSFVVHGRTLDMTYYTAQPEYTMRFWVSDGELRLKLLQNPCKTYDAAECSDALVKAAYQALPFETVG